MLEKITDFVAESGYLGIALLMLLENLFPPIPSELIMPMAGFAAADGHLRLPLVILSGSSGSLAGAMVWYYVGRWVGRERLKKFAARHGRLLTVAPADIDRAAEWFAKHGKGSVFFGRLVPAVRTLISVPAGISNMPLRSFVLFSALGTVLWTSFLAIAGHQLKDRYEAVSHWINPASNIVLGVLVLWYFARVLTFRERSVPLLRSAGD